MFSIADLIVTRAGQPVLALPERIRGAGDLTLRLFDGRFDVELGPDLVGRIDGVPPATLDYLSRQENIGVLECTDDMQLPENFDRYASVIDGRKN